MLNFKNGTTALGPTNKGIKTKPGNLQALI